MMYSYCFSVVFVDWKLFGAVTSPRRYVQTRCDSETCSS